MTIAAGRRTLIRSQTGTFLSHEVPIHLEGFADGKKTLDAKTSKLTTESPDPSLFEPSPDMVPFTGPVQVPKGTTSLMQLSGNPPAYPASAKQMHISGTVTFDAVIGKDGHVESLKPKNAPNPILLKAAQEAVVTWLYRPFQIDGLPFDVQTEITVNFTFG
jgi:TonB family protein